MLGEVEVLNPMSGIFIRAQSERLGLKIRHREEWLGKREAEVGFMLLKPKKVKDGQQPPEARTEQRSMLSWSRPREPGLAGSSITDD